MEKICTSFSGDESLETNTPHYVREVVKLDCEISTKVLDKILKEYNIDMRSIDIISMNIDEENINFAYRANDVEYIDDECDVDILSIPYIRMK